MASALIAVTLTAMVGAKEAPITSEATNQGRIVVALPVRVSEMNGSLPHEEVQIATDPTDARRLVACSILVSDDDARDQQTYLRPRPLAIVIYTSLDGGQSWKVTLKLDNHQHNNDPSCAFGPDGMAYFMSFGGDLYSALAWAREEFASRGSNQQFIHSRKTYIRMPMYRSADGGKTWTEVGQADVVDRDFVTVDDTSGAYRGRVYVHGMANGVSGIGVAGVDGARFYGLIFSYSTDRGETYKYVKLAEEGSQYPYLISNGVITSDGGFATIFGEISNLASGGIARELHPTTPNARLKFILSEDGGETFGKATVISDWYSRYDTLPGVPSLAVDRTKGAFRDRIYAAWVDARSGRGEIRFSRSDDKGRTWIPSFVISDNWPEHFSGESPDAFMPMLAVNRNGVLGVMWYDRRDHPDNLGYDIRFSASLDGGESFLPSVLVSAGGGSPLQAREALLWGPFHPSNRAQFTWSQVIDNGGDTAGLACDTEGVFHPLWIDRRLGLQQVWTTRISVSAAALANGELSLSLLHDLSEKVEVRYSLGRVDLTANTITIGAAIINTSKEPIPGRLILRLLGITSNNGYIEAQNADNHASTSGATWEFRTESGEPLNPGALTVPRQLLFKLAHAPFPSAPFGSGSAPLLEIRTKVIGR